MHRISIFRMLFVSAICFIGFSLNLVAQTPPNSGGQGVCNPMAQQRYSQLLRKCVILANDGVKLDRKSNVQDYAPTAFVIEDQVSEEELNQNPNYVSRVEVFLYQKGQLKQFLLTRTDDPDYASWSNGPFLLYLEEGDNGNMVYRLEKSISNRSVLIYAQ